MNAVCKKYRKKQEQGFFLDNFSLSINEGEIVGLLGANGAGKTTIIKCITGLLAYDAGEIFLGGYSIAKKRNDALTGVAVVLEGNRTLYWRLTVFENINYFLALRNMKPVGKEKIFDMLRFVGLFEKCNVQVEKLSRGMQQKLSIALALLSDARFIVLDEPTLGLDIVSRKLVVDLLKKVKERGVAIMISSHDMQVIEETCDRVVVLKDGRTLAVDSIANLKELFKTNAYKISFQGNESLESFKTAIAEYSAVCNFNETEGGLIELFVNITPQFNSTTVLNTMLSALIARDIQIEKMERIVPDFETVLLRLFEGNKEA